MLFDVYIINGIHYIVWIFLIPLHLYIAMYYKHYYSNLFKNNKLNRELNLQIAKLKTDVSEVQESLPEDLLLYCCSDFETKDTKIARTISLSSALSAVSPRLTSLYDCDMKGWFVSVYIFYVFNIHLNR